MVSYLLLQQQYKYVPKTFSQQTGISHDIAVSIVVAGISHMRISNRNDKLLYMYNQHSIVPISFPCSHLKEEGSLDGSVCTMSYIVVVQVRYTGECTPIKLLDSGHMTKHLRTSLVCSFVCVSSQHRQYNRPPIHCVIHSNTDTHITCKCHLHLVPHQP